MVSALRHTSVQLLATTLLAVFPEQCAAVSTVATGIGPVDGAVTRRIGTTTATRALVVTAA